MRDDNLVKITFACVGLVIVCLSIFIGLTISESEGIKSLFESMVFLIALPGLILILVAIAIVEDVERKKMKEESFRD